ncbi:MAG: hypothetical protein CMI60_11415 [Parvibaculum sp.]|nr:hypothetical protein [Parvibaculum sp.]
MNKGNYGGYLLRVNADIEDVIDVLYTAGGRMVNDKPFWLYDIYEMQGVHQYEVIIEVEDRYIDHAADALELEGMGVMTDV